MQAKAKQDYWWQRRFLLVWLGWAIAFLAIYYRQIGATFHLWQQDPTALQTFWTPLLTQLPFYLAALGITQLLGWAIVTAIKLPKVPTIQRWLQQFAWGGLGMSLLWVILAWIPKSPLLQVFPYAQEATIRLLGGTIGLGIILLAGQILGMNCFRALRWRCDNIWEAFVFQSTLGLGILAYLASGIGILGGFQVNTLRALVAIVVIVGLIWLKPQRFWVVSQQSIAAITQPQSQSGETLLWRTIALSGLLCAFLAALAPEIRYDALWYHLGFPRIWLEQGRIVDLPTEINALFPMTWDVLFGIGLSISGKTAAKLVHFLCLPLCAIAVYQITRRFIPIASPWLAVAFLVTVPTFFWEATTANVDLSLALHVILLLYALLRYESAHRDSDERDNPHERNNPQQWLILAGLNLGLALATKHLALVVMGLSAIGIFWSRWHQTRNVARSLRPAIILVCMGLLIVMPWYIRSAMATGNPFFPELYRIFGAPPERWDQVMEQGFRQFVGSFGKSRNLANLLLLPWNMAVHGALFGGTIGPLFVLILPTLLWQRFSHATRCLLGFTLLYMAIWASPLSNFQIRFIMPIVPCLAIVAAEAVALTGKSLQSLWRGGKVSFYVALALLLPLNLPPFTLLHEGDRVGYSGWLSNVTYYVPLNVVAGKTAEKDYLGKQVPAYQAWRYINATLSSQTKILSYADGDNFYNQRQAIWFYMPIVRPAATTDLTQTAAALKNLTDLQITHVMFDRLKRVEEQKKLAIAQPDVLAKHFALEYEDPNVQLYRLQP